MGQPDNFKGHQTHYSKEIGKLSVIPIGFEPMTYSLEGCRSIQLSYGTLISLRSAKIIFFSLQTRREVNNGCKNFCRLEKSPF